MDNKYSGNQNDPEYICIHFRALVCLLLFCSDSHLNGGGGKKAFLGEHLPLKSVPSLPPPQGSVDSSLRNTGL